MPWLCPPADTTPFSHSAPRSLRVFEPRVGRSSGREADPRLIKARPTTWRMAGCGCRPVPSRRRQTWPAVGERFQGRYALRSATQGHAPPRRAQGTHIRRTALHPSRHRVAMASRNLRWRTANSRKAMPAPRLRGSTWPRAYCGHRVRPPPSPRSLTGRKKRIGVASGGLDGLGLNRRIGTKRWTNCIIFSKRAI